MSASFHSPDRRRATPSGVTMDDDVTRAASEADGDLAVIGMAGRFPGAADVDALWTNLCGGVESITRVPAEELQPSPLHPPDATSRAEFVPAGGFLDGAER